MTRQLLPEERLDILRGMDGERKWYSLDDKRICTVCDRVFIGRQIEIEREARGQYRLHCPTANCPAEIGHWFLCDDSRAPFAQPIRRTAEVTFFVPEFGNG